MFFGDSCERDGMKVINKVLLIYGIHRYKLFIRGKSGEVSNVAKFLMGSNFALFITKKHLHINIYTLI